MVAEPPTRILFRPLQDFVLMSPVREDQTVGGLALPEGVAKGAQYRARRALVLAVGPGAWQDGKFLATTVKVGQVVYPVGPHIEIYDRGEEFWLCNEGQIAGVAAE